MNFVARSIIVRSLALAGLALILSACTESEGGANPTAVIGTVGRTSIVAMNDNDNLLFVDFSSGRIRRIVLSGADLTQPDMSSIAYNGGSGGLLSLMHDADGFVYVSNTNAIFKVVLQ